MRIIDSPASPIAAAGEAIAVLEVDTALYEREAILRACYKFTDRCYVFLAPGPEAEGQVQIHVRGKTSTDLSAVLGELCNELIDQSLRLALAREYGPIRDLIVAQAFSEGNLLDPQRDGGDYVEDPLGAGQRRPG